IYTTFRSAHLISVYGAFFIPWNLQLMDSLDVNKYANHHAHDIALCVPCWNIYFNIFWNV
ncbi:hypothetical protein WOLCODRAFT_70611, partial [Wolfiporia cocos MD-104 SS10]